MAPQTIGSSSTTRTRGMPSSPGSQSVNYRRLPAVDRAYRESLTRYLGLGVPKCLYGRVHSSRVFRTVSIGVQRLVRNAGKRVRWWAGAADRDTASYSSIEQFTVRIACEAAKSLQRIEQFPVVGGLLQNPRRAR